MSLIVRTAEHKIKYSVSIIISHGNDLPASAVLWSKAKKITFLWKNGQVSDCARCIFIDLERVFSDC